MFHSRAGLSSISAPRSWSRTRIFITIKNIFSRSHMQHQSIDPDVLIIWLPSRINIGRRFVLDKKSRNIECHTEIIFMRLFIQLAASPAVVGFGIFRFRRIASRKPRILCASSKGLPRMYLPKYELLVSTQKIAKGSIILSEIPSSPCYLNLFTSISLLSLFPHRTSHFGLFFLSFFGLIRKLWVFRGMEGGVWGKLHQMLLLSSTFSSPSEFQIFFFSIPRRTRINSLCKMWVTSFDGGREKSCLLYFRHFGIFHFKPDYFPIFLARSPRLNNVGGSEKFDSTRHTDLHQDLPRLLISS